MRTNMQHDDGSSYLDDNRNRNLHNEPTEAIAVNHVTYKLPYNVFARMYCFCLLSQSDAEAGTFKPTITHRFAAFAAMSWARDEWKDGLPTRALQKIEAMESELERSKRDKQQRQCQIDSLQAMLEKQKQIAEKEKALSVSSRRENQTLAENCENLERAKRKTMQELNQKDARYAAVEDQLKRAKASLDAETHQKSQIKVRFAAKIVLIIFRFFDPLFVMLCGVMNVCMDLSFVEAIRCAFSVSEL